MNDAMTYELADKGKRFIAFVIDAIIFGSIGGIFGLNVNLVGGGAISILLGTLYQWYFLTRHNGQTPGKMLMRLRVIKTDGSAITDGDAVLRYLGYVVGAMVAFIGFIWAFFDENNQAWHDKFAGTYVVTARPITNNSHVVVTPARGKAKNEDMYV